MNTNSESSNKQLQLPQPDFDNITVLTSKLPNKPILPWNRFDSPVFNQEDAKSDTNQEEQPTAKDVLEQKLEQEVQRELEQPLKNTVIGGSIGIPIIGTAAATGIGTSIGAAASLYATGIVTPFAAVASPFVAVASPFIAVAALYATRTGIPILATGKIIGTGIGRRVESSNETISYANDSLSGGSGNDSLSGGSGNDYMFIIDGGSGNDCLPENEKFKLNINS
ncbi:MAG TPA: hypothetical protein VK203_03860 [Nostocaceae cyanobacterium]|nr:hypothetical protein [Nostocaceae cyanobacterium]